MPKSFVVTKECIRNMHYISEEQFREAHTQAIAGLSMKFLTEHFQDKELLKKGGEQACKILFNNIRILINNIDTSPTVIVLIQLVIEQYLYDLSSICAKIAKANKEEANAELGKTSSQEEASASKIKH